MHNTSLYYALLKLYHYFPLHSPATLFVVNGSWGRFASQGGKAWGYLDGNKAWALMEFVSPLTFSTIVLRNTSVASLSPGSQLAVAMYLIHYSVRSVISPLVLAPKRSPQHVSVTLASIFFNLMNGYLMGSYIAGDPVKRGDERSVGFLLGLVGWALGLAGNVYHDEILHNLRRPSIVFRYLPFLRPAAITSSSSKRTKTGTDQDRANKTYFIPAGGLFPWVTFPNYLSEWFEWACYAYMTSPIPYNSHPPVSGLIILSKQYPSFARPIISRLLSLPIPFPGNTLLTPPWMFLIAEITAMVPRAINGERWYAEKFGAEWKETGRKGGRWICLPGLL